MARKRLTRDHHNMHKRHLCHGRDISTQQRERARFHLTRSSPAKLAATCRFGATQKRHLCHGRDISTQQRERARFHLTRSSPAKLAVTCRFGATQMGSSASIGEFKSSLREVPLLGRDVPANCLNPQSNLVRLVKLRWRRIQQYGHSTGVAGPVRVAGHSRVWSIPLHTKSGA